MDQPTPFEIAEDDITKTASNGTATLTIFKDETATMFKRRGQKGFKSSAPAEAVLPHLNQLAGDLLGKLDMPPDELLGRLDALREMVAPQAIKNVEWAVAELDGVRCYTDGINTVLTRKNLMP